MGLRDTYKLSKTMVDATFSYDTKLLVGIYVTLGLLTLLGFIIYIILK